MYRMQSSFRHITEKGEQFYILNPGRYVGIAEQEENEESLEEKMGRLTSELSDIFAKLHELEDEIPKNLGGDWV